MRPALAAIADAGLLTTRLRLYEMSNDARTTEASPGDGNDLVRQIGIKVWSDGSPWVGNIATSFPYLDTEATRALGIACTHGHANYTGEQIHDISSAYFAKGWQMACHAHGDDAITMVLDAWEQLLKEHPPARSPVAPRTCRRDASGSVRPRSGTGRHGQHLHRPLALLG